VFIIVDIPIRYSDHQIGWDLTAGYSNSETGEGASGFCPGVSDGLSGVVNYIIKNLGQFKSSDEIPLSRHAKPPLSFAKDFDEDDMALVLGALQERRPDVNFVLA